MMKKAYVLLTNQLEQAKAKKVLFSNYSFVDDEIKTLTDAIMELAAFRETFEVMQKLGEELNGVNPELTIVKLVRAALKER
jgi:hypothetical protein